MARLSKILGGICLLLAVAATVWSVSRAPEHGLMRVSWDNAEFKGKGSEPTLDQTIHFDTDGKHARHPEMTVTAQSSFRWTGFIELWRDGEYKFELSSDDGSALYIGDELLVDNTGMHRRKTIRNTHWLPGGIHPIRIDYVNAAAGGSLEVGFRLAAGYNTTGRIPVALLHPGRPFAPEGIDRALPMVVFGLVMLGILLLAGPRLKRWLRHVRHSPSRRRAVMAGALIFVAALGIRVADLGGQGETCDEWAYVGAGRLYAANCARGIVQPNQWKANREHPAVGKLYYAALTWVFGDHVSVPRAGAALLSALTVLVAFGIGLRLGGLTVAIPAGIILSLLPPVLAHANIGTLEAPLALLYTCAFALFLRAKEHPSQRQGTLLGLGLVIGLAIATKLSAALLLVFFFFAWGAVHHRRLRGTGDVPMPWALYLLPIIVVLPFFLTWPWLWSETLPHLIETLSHWKKNPGIELFMGELVEKRPRYYLLAYASAAVPVFVLFLASAGLAKALLDRTADLMVVLGWLALPFAWSLMSLQQGGYRYVYVAFVPLALLAGVGVAALTTLLHRHAAAVLTVVLAGYLSVVAYRAHPYHHYYYNEIMGGTSGVWENATLEVGYWGEGMHRATEWLDANAEKGATWSIMANVNHTVAPARRDLRRIRPQEAKKVRPNYLISDGTHGRLADPLEGYEVAFALKIGDATLVAVNRRLDD